MDVERVAEIIRKAKAILPHIKNPEYKQVATLMVDVMETNLKAIQEKNIPCPPELEPRLEAAFAVIESMYNKTAAN